MALGWAIVSTGRHQGAGLDPLAARPCRVSSGVSDGRPCLLGRPLHTHLHLIPRVHD
jgi:hypothetical protein